LIRIDHGKAPLAIVRRTKTPEKNQWADLIDQHIHQADQAAGGSGAFDIFGTVTFIDHASWTQALLLVKHQLRSMTIELNKLKILANENSHAMAALFYDEQHLRKRKCNWQSRMHCHALIRFGGPRLSEDNKEWICEAFRHLWTRSETVTSKRYGNFGGSRKGSKVDFRSYVSWKLPGTYLANRHDYFKTLRVCPGKARSCRRGHCHDNTKTFLCMWDRMHRSHAPGR